LKRLITVNELLNAPTGVDWATIAEKLSVTDPGQLIEDSQIIDIASEECGNWTGMSAGLHAKTLSETKRVVRSGFFGARAFTDLDGWLNIAPDCIPIISVSMLEYALGGSPLAFTTVTPLNLLIEGAYPMIWRITDFSKDWSFARLGGTVVKYTYVSGWANAVLTADAAHGDTTIQVDDTTGFRVGPSENAMPGDRPRIYDLAKTEDVTVTGVVDPTHLAVTALANDHKAADGVGVSCLPPNIKWAAALACVHVARTRGVLAVLMGGGGTEGAGSSAKPDEEAMDILEYYARRF
jgi:hypothetical protein